MPFSIRMLSHQKPPHIAWEAIKNKILSERYELSLVFVGSRRMKELNTRYRKKPKTTNVLAFPLGRESGEIFMDLHVAKREAPERPMPYRRYVQYLYIHALLHLKGFDHTTPRETKRMDKEEHQWLNAF